jgi:hypothetical protein
MMPSSQFPQLMGKDALPALGRARVPKPSKGFPKKKPAKGKRVPAGGLAAALSGAKKPSAPFGRTGPAC